MRQFGFGPFVSQEIRQRWRGWQGFVIVCGLTAVLGILVGLVYRSSYDWARLTGLPAQAQMAAAGADVLEQLGWMGLAVWLVLPAALTASAISFERERGTLEQLLLAPISPLHIVVGKLVASLLFMAVIFFTTLPFLAFTLYLGGVSPGEVGSVALAHAGSGLVSASVALAASARCDRSGSARRLACGGLVAWLGSSLVARVVAPFVPTSPWPSLLSFYGATNPFLALRNLGISRGPSVSGDSWLVSIAFELCLSLICILVASRFVRRPFAIQPWLEPAGKPRKASGLYASLPSLAFLSSNPVFRREIRSRFRMRRPSIWAVVAQVILILIVGAFYIFLMWSAWTEPSSRDVIYGFVIFGLLFFVVLGSALTGASGFAREKENGTWEALQLSSLAPDEILWGKVWAFLTATFIYILPLVPLLLASMDRNHSMNSAGPLQLLGSFILIGITGLLYHLFGLSISWGFRRTNPAVGWTLCAVTAFLVIWPIACAVSDMSGLVSGTHPFVALMAVNWGMGYPGSNSGQGILFDVLALIASAFLWGTLSNRMSNRKFDGL